MELHLQFNPLTINVSYHIETSQLIYIANQLTGFYMMGNIGRWWVKVFSFQYQPFQVNVPFLLLLYKKTTMAWNELKLYEPFGFLQTINHFLQLILLLVYFSLLVELVDDMLQNLLVLFLLPLALLVRVYLRVSPALPCVVPLYHLKSVLVLFSVPK